MIIFRIPFPPSVNDMYLNNKGKTGKGRILSPGYRAWRVAAGYMLNTQSIEAQTLPVPDRAWVEVQLNDRAVKDSADSDNRLKPVLDLLVTNKILKQDSKKYVRGSSVEWMEDLGDTECMVLIYTEADRG